MKKAVLLFFFCFIPIMGCQTVNPSAGKGAIKLSSGTVTGFEYYKTLSRPSYFAVSRDGTLNVHTRCPITAMAGCVDDGGDTAISECNNRAKARGRSSCFLFAREKEIIWEGSVSVQRSTADFYAAFVTGGTTTRTYFGRGTYLNNNQKIAIKMGTCEGEADLTAKTWVIRPCTTSSGASGTLVQGDGNEAFYGIGHDNQRGPVSFKLFDTQKVIASIERAVPSTEGPQTSIRQTNNQQTELGLGKYDNAAICIRALSPKADFMGWHDKLNLNYVAEAKRRGFSVSDCRDHAGYTTGSTRETSASSNTTVRSIAMEWEGIGELLAGEIHFTKGANGGTFSVNMPNRSAEKCTGVYSFKTRTEGIWSLACSDGRTANGEFRTHGTDAGSSGSGRDSEGKLVKFTVAAKRS